METFGSYRLIEQVGHGGMGEVWKAQDTRMDDRWVALKRLLPDLADQAEFRRRFQLEGNIAAKLSEVHVVPVHSVGEIDGQLYIDMRWIEGATLKARMLTAHPTPKAAVEIVADVAGALDAAHAAGLVHRDVKPANIMLTPNGHTYLIDFGLGRGVNQGDGLSLTRPGHVWGTPGYIAPERMAGVPDGPRGDVYSLACVLFELLAGSRAFPDGDVNDDERPDPSALRSDIPKALSAVVRRGMDRDPERRHGSAGEFAHAARKALKGKRRDRPTSPRAPGGGSASAGHGPGGTKIDRPRAATASPRSGTASKLFAGALVVSLTAAVVWFTTGPSGDQDAAAQLPAIQVARSPGSVAVTPDGRTLVVPDSERGTVNVADLKTRAVVDQIQVGADPRAVVLDRSGRRAYVTNAGSGTLSVIDVPGRKIAATIRVGDSPTSAILQNDGSRIFVGNEGSADVVVVDTRTNAVVDTIGIGFLWTTEVHGLALSQDGTRLLATVDTDLGSDTVAVIDVREGRVQREIEVGDEPRGVAISADGKQGYVANSDSGTVSVVDLTNSAVVTDVEIGGAPTELVRRPDGKAVYVTNPSGGVATLDTATNRAPSERLAGDTTATEMALAPDGRSAYLVGPGSPELNVVDLP
ncbi:YVTN family beta-propeller protein [Pseudonocardia sediminis]|uniref:YVTN family beta-propeller protein n=1 Tax=Pseudonocardia sediminis TaxID=1397368 RepID=A0A4Q7V337_PSEST|nr:serine/threonine-protein kinase [Pseudonocardia sediminis]RZT86999.1 YVTN family beta-propeller protein [Pseudonocardia sediminis]